MLGILILAGAVIAAVAVPAAGESPGLRLALVAAGAAGPLLELILRRASGRRHTRDRERREREAAEGRERELEQHRQELEAALATAGRLADLAAGQGEALDRHAAAVDALAADLAAATTAIAALAEGAGEPDGAARAVSGEGQGDGSLAEMLAAARTSSAAIAELTGSLEAVAGSVVELSTAAEETSSSMSQMDLSIHLVQRNANDTAALSEEAASAADSGAGAIAATIEAISTIKTASQEATRVMAALGASIGEVGTILQVIDDVAEQTNLLALNAAIIAAQAGEHGKGFAVVADEIKDLAERAGTSTREIAALIEAIQAETRNAVAAVERGSVAVDDGVRVSQRAGDALRRIRDSADKSRYMVRDIARATVEQARSSKQVTGAIDQIADTIGAMATTARDRSQQSRELRALAERMQALTGRVEEATGDHAGQRRRLAGRVQTLCEGLRALAADQDRHAARARDARAAVAAAAEALRGRSADLSVLRQRLEGAAEAAARLRRVP